MCDNPITEIFHLCRARDNAELPRNKGETHHKGNTTQFTMFKKNTAYVAGLNNKLADSN
jgi:hypothetical protein